MNNISKCKGQRLKDKYKGGAEKLYDLCDYINKKALLWYGLDIKFNEEEVNIITIAQQTLEDMKEIIKNVEEDEGPFDYLDLGYEVDMQLCDKCNGKVKVIEFHHDHMGFEYNVYKCENCDEKYYEEYPNNIIQFKLYNEYVYALLDNALLLEGATEESKLPLIERKKIIQATEKEILEKVENLLAKRFALKEIVLASIKTNGEIYKTLFKHKHHFDRN